MDFGKYIVAVICGFIKSISGVCCYAITHHSWFNPQIRHIVFRLLLGKNRNISDLELAFAVHDYMEMLSLFNRLLMDFAV
jgi:hypothetical protein